MIRQEPHKSAAEPQIKFVSSDFWVLGGIKTDSCTSNYLCLASCIFSSCSGTFSGQEEIFLPGSGQRLKFKMCIKAAFSSVSRRMIFLCYMRLCHRSTAQTEEPRYPSETGFFINQTTWSFSIQVHWKMAEYQPVTTSEHTNGPRPLLSQLLGDSCTFTART